MINTHPDPLALSRRALRILIKLNLLVGAFILALLIASLVADTWVFTALGVKPVYFSSKLFIGMRLIMVLGICTVPVVHFVTQRLLLIVDSVRTGNPFVAANAIRLRAIAWALLALELLHFAVGLVGSKISSATGPLHLSWGFSITRCVAVLMLFVLARVFEEGARMREDLEGTV